MYSTRNQIHGQELTREELIELLRTTVNDYIEIEKQVAELKETTAALIVQNSVLRTKVAILEASNC